MLESLDEPQARLEGIVRLLECLVPCDGCVLLEAANGDEPRFTFLPKPANGDPSTLKAAMTRCLQMIASEGSGPLTGETTPQIPSRSQSRRPKRRMDREAFTIALRLLT